MLTSSVVCLPVALCAYKLRCVLVGSLQVALCEEVSLYAYRYHCVLTVSIVCL